jgi:uncharacterized lipoprotein YbaY
MRLSLLALSALLLVVLGATAASVTDPEAPEERMPDSGGVSIAALSRCAGIAGLEMREADAAFGQIMLDGAPWLTAQRGGQTTLVSSTGTLRRRNGTAVSFRFNCVLEGAGHATMFNVTLAGAGTKVEMPASRLVRGAAAATDLRAPLPRGLELQVQLLDVTRDAKPEILAEQVVRSGWEVPIPFELRLPVDAQLDGRRLAIDARVVLARRVISRTSGLQPVTIDQLKRPVMLELEAVAGR